MFIFYVVLYNFSIFSRSLIIEKLKLCVKRMRFSRFSFYRGEEKTKIWKINLFKVSIFFICLLLFSSRLFSSLRKRIYLHLLQIWPKGTIFLAPRYWSTLKIASIAKKRISNRFQNWPTDGDLSLIIFSALFFLSLPTKQKILSHQVQIRPQK